MKFKISKKEVLKNLLWVFILSAGITIYYYIQYKTIMIKDGLFLSGLLFMCSALYRVVRYLGLFDNTIYGVKRIMGKTNSSMTDDRTLDFHEYWQEHEYKEPVWELLFVSICAMAIGLI